MVGLTAFNDDATETKGISLFSINVLAALPANNTDDEVDVVRSLVAHEYFHNWSGRDSNQGQAEFHCLVSGGDSQNIFTLAKCQQHSSAF